MKRYFKLLALLAVIAPVTAACSNNSNSSSKSSSVQSSSSKASTKKSSAEKSSQESSAVSSSSSSSEVSQSSSSEESNSSSATSSSSQKETTTADSKMNLDQIKNGDYSSVEGSWKVVKAVARHTDITDRVTDGLNTVKTGIASSDMSVSAEGITINQNNKTYPVEYISKGDGLTVGLTNKAASKVPINYSISFYPAGSKNFTVDGEKQDPPTKDTIVIWTSNNNMSEVFQEK